MGFCVWKEANAEIQKDFVKGFVKGFVNGFIKDFLESLVRNVVRGFVIHLPTGAAVRRRPYCGGWSWWVAVAGGGWWLWCMCVCVCVCVWRVLRVLAPLLCIGSECGSDLRFLGPT